jgi:putative ABC transport system permease protein
MFDDIVSGVRPAILGLMGAVAFVLLIACANVADLLIVQRARRTHICRARPRGRAVGPV